MSDYFFVVIVIDKANNHKDVATEAQSQCGCGGWPSRVLLNRCWDGCRTRGSIVA